MEHEEADAGRDGRTCLARPNFQARTGTEKIFPVQLTTNRNGNLARLIYTLLYIMTIHTYTNNVTCTLYFRLLSGHLGVVAGAFDDLHNAAILASFFLIRVLAGCFRLSWSKKNKKKYKPHPTKNTPRDEQTSHVLYLRLFGIWAARNSFLCSLSFRLRNIRSTSDSIRCSP